MAIPSPPSSTTPVTASLPSPVLPGPNSNAGPASGPSFAGNAPSESPAVSDAGGRVAGSPFSSGSNVVSSGPPTAYPGGFGGPTPIGRGPSGGSVPYAGMRRRSVNPALFVIAGFFLALSGILGLGVLAAEVWFFTTPDGQQALETATEQASTDPRVNREQMKEAVLVILAVYASFEIGRAHV